MNEKDYPARCHVCGREYMVRAGFLSGAQYADGRVKHACTRHTAEEVRSAWLKGLRLGGPAQAHLR